MSGNKEPEFSYKSIVYSEFYVHPDFPEPSSLNEKEFEWLMPVDFRIIKRKQFWDQISIEIKLTLVQKSDNKSISKLKITSAYSVTAGMSFDHKFQIVNMLIDVTLAQLQGGWEDKHSGTWIQNIIPQILFKSQDVTGSLKKRIYERWD